MSSSYTVPAGQYLLFQAGNTYTGSDVTITVGGLSYYLMPATSAGCTISGLVAGPGVTISGTAGAGVYPNISGVLFSN